MHRFAVMFAPKHFHFLPFHPIRQEPIRHTDTYSLSPTAILWMVSQSHWDVRPDSLIVVGAEGR